MIRILNAYFPMRTVFLGISELVLAIGAFLIAMIVHMGPLNARIALNYEGGLARLALIVLLLSCCMYFFDLYDSLVLRSRRETFARMTQVLGSVCPRPGNLYTIFPPPGSTRACFAAARPSPAVSVRWPAFSCS